MCSSGKRFFMRQKILCNYWFDILQRFQYSTEYKSSLLLPQTDFPHKVNAANRRKWDRIIEEKAEFSKIYSWQRTKDALQEFILHDGPPYANGDVHLGHAVNKILKDITVRNKLLNGCKIHFVPGWDCHGLPIELKVLKGNDQFDTTGNELRIRKKAYDFSQKAKDKQLKSFMEWGILADWDNPYVTCNPNYIIQQLNVFQNLYEQGLIFEDYKPVFWSPCNRTSLAEAELEYNANHVSISAFVKFAVKKCPDFIRSTLGELKHGCDNFHIVIWTTTPWTLPANQAVCYSADKMYSIVLCRDKQEFYLVASELVSSLTSSIEKDLTILQTFAGSLLKELTYSHPIFENRECPLVPSNHVTMTKGTGLVHTAPNHGLEDYSVFKMLGMPIDVCLVNETGCYTKDAGEHLAGKSVLGSGSESVIDLLCQNVLCLEEYVHSYPYDWRSKTPVIIRSSNQWFIDVNVIKEKAMNRLHDVAIIPEHFRKVFFNQLESAPQWCISRQRAWGVPIPVFYDENNNIFVHKLLTQNLCNLIQKHGIHCWWELSLDYLLPSHLKKQCGLPENVCRKGSDIMDIWFDSGISWKAVLPETQLANICIEGVDQIRGWFNSSLLTSVALQKRPPYKKLFLHGFTTDADGRKMSKSEGNVISPTDVISGLKKYNLPALGIDTLRWWVAFHACQHENIAVKPTILEECSQNLNKMRNIFKFLLGNLYEFDPLENIFEAEKMRPLDVYMLHNLLQFHLKAQKNFDELQFKSVTKDILNFVSNDVSSFYCHLIKDRLYCDLRNSEERLSCQTVLYFILNTMIYNIAPICPHLAEEVTLHHPHKHIAPQGAFRTQWPCLNKFLACAPSTESVTFAIQIRDAILKTDVKTPDMLANIVCSTTLSDELKILNKHTSNNSGLKEFFQVSELLFDSHSCEKLPEDSVTVDGCIEGLVSGKQEAYSVILRKTKFHKCPRCRLYYSPTPSTLCHRCGQVTNSLTINSSSKKISL